MYTGRLFHTMVKVKPVVVVYGLIVWGVVTWLGLSWHPGRGLGQALLIGLISALLMLLADYGHAVAHIFSARWARAPMDELLFSEEMPRTLYWNNDVSPDVHRMRALGGPIFNALSLLLSLGIYAAVPVTGIVRELAGWSALAHGLMLIMSLSPLPMVDGGTLLKWTLVARGRTPAQADALVRRVDWGMAVLGGISGAALLAMRVWLAGAMLMGIAGVVTAVTGRKPRDG